MKNLKYIVILILCFLLGVIPVKADHTFGNSSTLQNCTADPCTLSFTPDSGSTVLVLFIITVSATDRTGGSPTFNGATMTQADSTRKAATAPETSNELWYLISPAITTANISIPNTGVLNLRFWTSTGKAAGGFTSALDVANGGQNNGSANPGVSVTTTTNGGIIFAMVGSGANAFSPTARAGTNLVEFDGGAYGGGIQYFLDATAGVQLMDWTFATADDWGAVVAAFKEVAAGAPAARRKIIVME